MKREFKKLYEVLSDRYKLIDLNMIDSIKDILINSVCYSNNRVFKYPDKEIVGYETDDYNPFVLKMFNKDKGYNLLVDKAWYQKNIIFGQNIIKSFIKNNKSNYIAFYAAEFVNDDIVDCLCQNSNIKEIRLSGTLIMEFYQKFKKAHKEKVYSDGVDNDLVDVFDSMIVFNCEKKLLGSSTLNYNYYNLISNKLIELDTVDESDFKYFKYINSNCELVISDKCNYRKVIEYFKSNNRNNIIVIELSNKEKFNFEMFSNEIGYNNLCVMVDYNTVKYDIYKRDELVLYDMIKPVLDYSPFEKFIYVYNVVKNYKKYKEIESDYDNPKKSRSIYYILHNEYMVCVGYALLLSDLLNKLKIGNNKIGVMVAKDGEIVNVRSNHARLYVNIVDDKYGINGFYVSDPTWDNDLENDYYEHMLMLSNMVREDEYMIKNELFERLLNVNNIGEFNKITNELIKNNNFSEEGLLSKMIDFIKEMDIDYYKVIVKKYKIRDISDKIFFNGISEDEGKNKSDVLIINNSVDEKFRKVLLKDISKYIVFKVNNKISKETILKVIKFVYKNCYHYSTEEIDKKMLKIINDNKIFK